MARRSRGTCPSGSGWFRLAAPILTATFAACAGGSWAGTESDPATLDFAEELAIDLSSMEMSASGLYTLDLAPGVGAVARSTSLVTIHYMTWLADGTLVDSSVGGEPFVFRLGGQEVIRGWNEGIPGMKIGGRRKLVVRPGLAYGSRGTARVPPHATLVFEVQLVDVR